MNRTVNWYGKAVSVSDAEIVESVFELAENEGVYSEPAAASPIAALKKLIKDGTMGESETVVCIITGHGLKDPRSVVKTRSLPVIEPNLEALSTLITA